jgi:hypothetical protein
MRIGRTAAGISGALAMLALGAVVSAQGPGPGWGGFDGRGPGGPGGPGGREFGGGRPVLGAPYSGTEVRTFVESLANGNTITHSTCANVYRDSSGDTREEVTPNASACASTPQFIVITNLAAGFRYDINVAKGTYFQMKLRTPPASATPPSGPPPGGRGGPNGDQVQKSSLGNQSIAGTSLFAEGTQTTLTIPAGKIGNAQAITMTSTRWYSPDLHVVIQSSTNDPRGGNSSSQLSNVSTAEPAGSLFQLPSGLTLETGHQGGRGQHGPPPPPQ